MSEAANPGARGQQIVFIVDDDPSICEGLANLLESVGIPTQSYHPQKLSKTAGIGKERVVCCLDARLPGISGVAFQEQMRANRHRSAHHLHDGARRYSDGPEGHESGRS